MSAAPAIRIDLASTVPAYRQIADGIRAQLVAHAVSAGELLPTVRQLAVDLGVHHNTVAEAYRTLAAEGWLDLTRRRGATVLVRSTPKSSPEADAQMLSRLRSLVAEAVASGIAREKLSNELRQLSVQVAANATGKAGKS